MTDVKDVKDTFEPETKLGTRIARAIIIFGSIIFMISLSSALGTGATGALYAVLASQDPIQYMCTYGLIGAGIGAACTCLVIAWALITDYGIRTFINKFINGGQT